jgi:hypothetical protein
MRLTSLPLPVLCDLPGTADNDVHQVQLRAFISFAVEDARIRDLFAGQGKYSDTPWEIAVWSLHIPFSEKWTQNILQSQATICSSLLS